MQNFQPRSSESILSSQDIATGPSIRQLNELRAPFFLTDLPYSYRSLEPIIDANTMRLHHDKHHRAYVEKLNGALHEQQPLSLIDIFKANSKMPPAVQHNAGGHWNHAFFWSILSGNVDNNAPSPQFKAEVERAFGSFEAMKEQFQKAGEDHFASGWVWLIRDESDALKIVSLPNQDNPQSDNAATKGWPILAADLWEHAYYLKYQNRRNEFLENFWHVVNWKVVEAYDRERPAAARSPKSPAPYVKH